MERQEFKSHISEQLNQNLEGLFNQLLEMGGLVERQLEHVISAVQNGDLALAKEVLQLDKIINREEMEIDRMCASVLARQQPAASDLRLIIMGIRIAIDLERMGDEAVKVAQLVIKMNDADLSCKVLPGYDALVALTIGGHAMLKKVLNAFARLDLSDVRSVFADEVEMDKVFKDGIQIVNDSFKESDLDAELLLAMVNALRASERVTDHSENIAESIIYLVQGQDVRNMDSEKLSEFLTKVES